MKNSIVKSFPFVATAKVSEAMVFADKTAVKNYLDSKGQFGVGVDTIFRYGYMRLWGIRYEFRPLLTKYIFQRGACFYVGFAMSKKQLRQGLGLSKRDKVYVFPKK